MPAHPLSMQLAFALVASLVAVASADYDGFWRQSCSMVTQTRIDPIVSRGKLPSVHTHMLCGGSSLAPNSTTATLRASVCTSSTTAEDFSLYWAPTLHFAWANGSFSTVPATMAQYYFSGPTTFPDDIQILAGNPFATSLPSDPVAAYAMSWNCLNGSSSPSFKGWPNGTCSNGLQTRLYLPRCWNGKDLSSPDFTSHMAYPVNSIYGDCPSSHSVKLPMVVIENLYFTQQFNWAQGKNTSWPFVWANGNQEAYGLHGDFYFGWNRAAFDQANQKCIASSNLDISAECSGILHNNAAFDACKVSQANDEHVTGTLPSLPGCNPLFNAQTGYTSPSCPGQQTPAVMVPFTGWSGSEPAGTCTLSGDAQIVPSVSTYGYRGCAGYTSTAPFETFLAYYQTTESCAQMAAQKNLTSFGLVNGGSCYGSTSVVQPNTINHCDMPGRTNSSQISGGINAFSIWVNNTRPLFASAPCQKISASQYNAGYALQPSSAVSSSSSRASSTAVSSSASVSSSSASKASSTAAPTSTQVRAAAASSSKKSSSKKKRAIHTRRS